MRRVALFLAACAAVSAIGLHAQQADLIASTNNPSVPSQPVPRLIMFSGTVKDLIGKPLTGPVELNFAIYKEQADAAPLWQESQTLNVDEQGHYTALLGAMQPEGLPVDLFTSGQARWLGVSVGRLPEQPRVLLVSVPYALKANDAEMLAGKPASAYALAQPAGASTSAGSTAAGTTGRRGAATSDLATPGKPKSGPKPNVAGTGTQYYVPRWVDSAGTLGNSVIYQTGNNVGIGTTTPTYRLDVVGGSARVTNPSGTTQLVVSGSATSGRLGQDAAGFFFSSDTNGGAIRLLTNNGSLHEWMRVTSAGNIGIGTASPGARLDVLGNGGARIQMGDAGFAGYGAIALSNLLNKTGYNFLSSSADLKLYINRPSGNAISFRENNVEQMVIAAGGKVGIGTATPVSALDVAGTTGLNWTDNVGNNLGLVTVGTPATGGSLYINTPSLNTSYQSGLGIDGTFGTPYEQSVINIRALGVHASGAWGSQLAFWTTNGTALNQQMSIDKTGNVGIGTTTPAHKLDVAGDINASTNIKAGGNLSVTGTISGNGSGLTNVTAATAAIASGLATGTYSNALTFSNAGNSFTGNGSGLTNVAAATATTAATATNALALGSVAAANYARLDTGNTFTANQTISGNLSLTGTVNGVIIVQGQTGTCTVFGFVGTCLSANVTSGSNGTSAGSGGTGGVVRANSITSGGVGASPLTSPVVGANSILDGVVGGTISGGGGNITYTGGITTAHANTVTNHWGTVSGGARNQAGDSAGTSSTSCCQSVGGGWENTASGEGATVAGGGFNTASGKGATVPGGGYNIASGNTTFAAGCQANAANDGAFVWNGNIIYTEGVPPVPPTCGMTVTSSAAGQFVANAPGGFWLGNATVNTTATQPSGDFLYTTTGAVLTTSGVWTNNSDRNLKTAFEPLDESRLLGRIRQLPITSWRYKVDPSSIRHIGPMAQDFYSAFELGNDDQHISTIDEGGVALAGVQALYRLSLEKDAQIRKLTAEVNRLKNVERQMTALQARLARLEVTTAKPQPRSIKRAAPAQPAPASTTLAKVQF